MSISKPLAARRLLTWGNNISGALGRGEIGAVNLDQPGFLPTPADDPPVQVSAGWGHTAFVTQSGKAVLCGRAIDMRNTLRFGKLSKSRPRLAYFWTKYLGGEGSIDFPEPTAITGELKAKMVCASAGLTLGITQNGVGFALGANRYGQAGIEDVTDDRPVFTTKAIKLPNENSLPLVDIAVGHQNACAVDSAGDIYTWGKGDRGQTGRGEAGVKESPTRLPTKLERFDSDGIKTVRCGFFHCLALSNSGRVYVWGKSQAEAGTKDATSPTAVPGLPPIAEIACGQYHSVVRSVDGQVFQWGLRPFDLGAGFISQPQRIQGIPVTASSISCGFTESAILDNGVVYIWDWKDMRARSMQEVQGYYVEQLSFGWLHKAAIVRV